MRKRIIIIITSVLVFCVAAWMVFTQLYRPIVSSVKEISCETSDATYVGLESLHQRYNNGELDQNEAILFAYNGTLPSENPKDYMNIYYTIEGTNRNLFDDFIINVGFKDITKYSDRVLYGYDSYQILPGYAYNASEYTLQVMITVYIADLSEEQIRELSQSIELSVLAEGKYLGKREQDISSKSCEDIRIEETLSLNITK